MKIAHVKLGLVLLVVIPIFLYQFVHLISWIAAEPIEMIEYTDLKYDSVPKDAKTYIVNHGNAIFSTHGTISDEPFRFIFRAILFVVSSFIFVLLIRYVERKNT